MTDKKMTVQEMILDKLKTIEEKVNELPTDASVKAWIEAAVLKHTVDCINQSKKRTSVSPLRIGEDTRNWITKIIIAGALFGGGASINKIVSLFGGGI